MDDTASSPSTPSRVAEIARLVSGNETASAFTQLLFSRADAEDLKRFSPRFLAQCAEDLFAWVMGGPGPMAAGAQEPFRIRVREAVGEDLTILEINSRDRPFLVTSLLEALAAEGADLKLFVHPILCLARTGGAGAKDAPQPLTDARDGEAALVTGAEGAPESVMFFLLQSIPDEATRQVLLDHLSLVLGQVIQAVDDFDGMHARLSEVAATLVEAGAAFDDLDRQEATAFLNWLAEGNFVLLGARDYAYVPGSQRGSQPGSQLGQDAPSHGPFKAEPSSGLGILREDGHLILRAEDRGGPSPVEGLAQEGEGQAKTILFSDEVRRHLEAPFPLTITKSTATSLVHRRTRMDFIGVKEFDETGHFIRERRFLGLFASAAYTQSPEAIPYLRRKVALVLEKANLDRGGQDENALRHILETYPRDEMFQIDVSDLLEVSLGILRLSERPRAKLFLRYDRFLRFASVLAFFPRDRFSSTLRERVGRKLAAALGGRVSAFYTQLGDGQLTRVHFIFGLRGRSEEGGPLPAPEALEALFVSTIRSWSDRLREVLLPAVEGGIGEKYGNAFPAAYREEHTPETALSDIQKFEQMLAQDQVIGLRFDTSGAEEAAGPRLRVYSVSGPLRLSRIVALLETFGLSVISEAPFPIRPGRTRDHFSDTYWVHDFRTVFLRQGREVAALPEASLEESIGRIWEGYADSDGLNGLTLLAGLTSRQVAIFRAYTKYRLQLGAGFSQAYMEEALLDNADIVRQLKDYYEIRFSPEGGVGDTEAAASDAKSDILAALEAVESLDQDRILRGYLNLIEATLRTNAFTLGPRDPLAFKLRPALIDDLPPPHAFAEIFVYAPDVEGIHFRFGPIARGGLRWSDRREDFRTEVLKLVKAQQVKNAVIVPVGAKGGFYAKDLPDPSDRERFRAAGVAAYRRFIGSLLQLTDNIDPTTNEIKQPETMTLYDEEDAYLVVAADKGTATFSDIANEIAGDRGFWLDDAFASGGSNGYDHKAMGITARGAWEAVKRHFRELGHDTQKEPFTVIGVGDMSGDVFGNGMLLSDQIKLVAAFDHRHIFLDPDPDVAVSFKERKRLFALPTSTWESYDAALLSKGGAIFSRRQKRLTLTAEIRALLEIDETSLSPPELINRILQARADLLWFGGIGTYIKAAEERDFEVEDNANNAVRVTAEQVRVRVIGEGANLGVTQRGRIALARQGVRLNTDAIDNSAGVDCSDHEVNIKILLNGQVAGGDLSRDARNALLVQMTDEVAELVLHHNRRQTLTLSLAEQTARADLDSHQRLMRRLEAKGLLNRSLETLPTDEVIQTRREKGEGLVRPELAVLLAYAKIDLFNGLLATDIPDLPSMDQRLQDYFPTPLRERYGEAIAAHPLRREIKATVLANELIDFCGITFLNRARESVGSTGAGVARAYVAMTEVFEVSALRRQIAALDGVVTAEIQLTMHVALANFLRREILWALIRLGDGLVPREVIARFQPGVRRLTGATERLTGFFSDRVQQAEQELQEAGVPDGLARRIATLPPLTPALDIVDIAHDCSLDVLEAAEGYYTLGSVLGLDDMIEAGSRLKAGEHYDRLAIRRILADVSRHQRRLAEIVLSCDGGAGSAQARLNGWLEAHSQEIDRYQGMLDELEMKSGFTLSKLSLSASRLGDFIARIERTG